MIILGISGTVDSSLLLDSSSSSSSSSSSARRRRALMRRRRHTTTAISFAGTQDTIAGKRNATFKKAEPLNVKDRESRWEPSTLLSAAHGSATKHTVESNGRNGVRRWASASSLMLQMPVRRGATINNGGSSVTNNNTNNVMNRAKVRTSLDRAVMLPLPMKKDESTRMASGDCAPTYTRHPTTPPSILRSKLRLKERKNMPSIQLDKHHRQQQQQACKQSPGSLRRFNSIH
mmetsp:Transcript_15892/g.44543  ORF Transcript_15892/g.44543 Transcript_15892/m.44543 type:complete len:232 (+) Transcript_15892:46-741(+)